MSKKHTQKEVLDLKSFIWRGLLFELFNVIVMINQRVKQSVCDIVVTGYQAAAETTSACHPRCCMRTWFAERESF